LPAYQGAIASGFIDALDCVFVAIGTYEGWIVPQRMNRQAGL
jgi:hypothetical protein